MVRREGVDPQADAPVVRRIDLSQPFVDAMLPEGHRLHVVLEGISRGFSAVNICEYAQKAPSSEALAPFVLDLQLTSS